MTHVRIKPRKTKKGMTYHVCVVSVVDGKEKSESKWSGTSKEEAGRVKRKLEKRLQDQRAGVDDPTLGEVLDAYVKYLEAADKPSLRTVKSYVHANFSGALRDVRLSHLTPGLVEDWIEEMKAKPRDARTINHGIGYIRTAINRARKSGAWEGGNPVERVSKLRVGKRAIEILWPEEVERALPFFKEERDRALVGFTYEMITRFGESVAIQKDRDVDLERRRIVIRESHGRNTKDGDERVLPITDRALRWVELAIETSGDSPFLFPWHDGGRQPEGRKCARMLRTGLAKAGLVKGYKVICRRQTCPHLLETGSRYTARTSDEIDRRCPRCDMLLWHSPIFLDVTFRSLRNAGATRMILDGVPESIVKELLGHDDFEMLKRHYFQANPDRMREAIEGADRRGSADNVASLDAVRARKR